MNGTHDNWVHISEALSEAIHTFAKAFADPQYYTADELEDRVKTDVANKSRFPEITNS